MAKKALTTDVAEAKPEPIKPDPIRALILQLEALSADYSGEQGVPAARG